MRKFNSSFPRATFGRPEIFSSASIYRPRHSDEMSSSSAQPSALSAFSFNISSLRSYIFRLPLFTRAVLLIIVICWLLELQSLWDVVTWGALIPNETNISTRTNISFQFEIANPARESKKREKRKNLTLRKQNWR